MENGVNLIVNDSNLVVKTAAMLNEITDEVKRAREKFPNPTGSMTALTEEVGELAKALLEEPMENVVREAIQVAAMAIRVATEGDDTLNEIRARRVPMSNPHGN